MEKLKFDSYSIVFQEVPGEVTLAINITGCPHHCVGCHSEHLSNNTGDYISENLPRILSNYKDSITCVCFMGGEYCPKDLLKNLTVIKEKYGLKTCLYSGTNNIDSLGEFVPWLDFLKVGSYKKNLGGLNSPRTNQRFYSIYHAGEGKHRLDDNTHLFQERGLNEVHL